MKRLTTASALTLTAALTMSGPAAAQSQPSTGPVATYWMTAQTSSGLPGMGGGGPDMNRLKALGGGKMPAPDPKQLEELGKLASQGGGLPGLGAPGGPKLPGLGNLPPGFNPFKKS